MTSISGEAVAQSERGVSVETRKTMSTQFAAIMMAKIIEENIRKRIKCCHHEAMINHQIVDEVVTLARKHKRSAYHYDFVFFDIVDPGKKHPFLLIYTVAHVVSDERINVIIGTMVSDNVILEWHKVRDIAIYNNYATTGLAPDPKTSQIVMSVCPSPPRSGTTKLSPLDVLCKQNLHPHTSSEIVASIYHVTVDKMDSYLHDLPNVCLELLRLEY